jgi:hypothetical protein
MPIPDDATQALDAILLHAEQNQLTLIAVTRKRTGAVEHMLCCQIVEEGRLTIVPVAQIIDIGTFDADYDLPPEFARLVVNAAHHDIEVSVPGVEA